MSDPPAAGEVFRYPFLWRRQADAGETAGRKTRPVCMAVSAAVGPGQTLLFILALTTQPPRSGRRAIDVPQIEARRAGLDGARQSWVMLDEVNVDVLERSFAFEDRTPMGRFSPSFTKTIQSGLREARRAARLKTVRRS